MYIYVYVYICIYIYIRSPHVVLITLFTVECTYLRVRS